MCHKGMKRIGEAEGEKSIITTQLLNYFIIVGKLFLWDCRRNQIKSIIKGNQNKIANKYETEHKIKKE